WYMAWLKLDEDINVTVRAEIIAQYRAEQRELANMMSAAEHFKLMCGNRQLCTTHDYPPSELSKQLLCVLPSIYRSLGHFAVPRAGPGIDHTCGCLYNCLCPGTTPTIGTGRLHGASRSVP